MDGGLLKCVVDGNTISMRRQKGIKRKKDGQKGNVCEKLLSETGEYNE